MNNPKGKQYSAIKYRLTIIDIVYLVALLLIFLSAGLSKSLAQLVYKVTANSYSIIALYLFAVSFIYYVLDFPLNFYRSFVLEHKFSLTTQKISDWFLDQIKAGSISYIISVILFEVFYYILRYNPNTWWLIVSLFWVFFNFILAKLAPVIIIPLFFKYRKLSDEALKARIINLAEKMRVRILDVFEIDFSKKTLKANAAFVGWGATKRVILADTLRDKYSYDEIEIILAHEFAHYRLKHLIKLVLINSLITVLTFYLIFKSNGYLLNIFGLVSLSDIAALPLIFFYVAVFSIIMQPLGNYLSRRMERNADCLALRITGLKEAFVSMMEKLASQNLADRSPSKIIKIFFFDHPPIDERIALAKKLD
jgi:STE24 endopeptidase